MISINSSLCDNCRNCILCCPWHIFIDNNEKIPKIVNEELCVLCGHCVAVCEKNAIIHCNFPRDFIEPIEENLIPNFNQTLELIRTRRSIRAFHDKPVEEEKIRKIISGSCFAPSSNNKHLTEYTLVKDIMVLEKIKNLTLDFFEEIYKKLDNPIFKYLFLIYNKEKAKRSIEQLPAYNKLLETCKNGQDLILHNAPVLLFLHSNKNTSFSKIDDSLTLQNLILLCHSMNLGSFYAGYVVAACQNNNKIQKLLHIPKENRINGCLAIGYPRLIYKNCIKRKNPNIEVI